MIKSYILIVCSIGCSLLACTQQAKFKLPGQDKDFPIETLLDTNQLNTYKHVFNFETFKKKDVIQLRQFLQPYVDKEDTYAMYLYAKTYDLFEFGVGTPKEADTALLYYQKASEKNLAIADYFLSKLYEYGFMNVPPNADKAMLYLQKALLHGDSLLKSDVYGRLASIYRDDKTDDVKPNFSTQIKPNNDSCIFFLEKAVSLNPKNTWAIDWLASIYEDKKKYKEATEMYLQSDNENSILKVAKWLIEGKYIPKDVQRGLKLIFPIAEKINKEYPYPDNNYMGGTHPVEFLNNLAHCEQLLTKEQIGKYWVANFICD